jgi:TolA-binding protein
MKCSITVFALVVISLFTPLVYAQDVASQGGSPMGTDMDEQLSRMQKDMSAMLQQISQLRQQSQLQKNMNVMQRQIEELQSTTDPNKRQRLIQEHLQTMQDHMKIIRSMDESEAGTISKIESRQSVHGRTAGPGRMMYGPNAVGAPGGMIYGPGGPGTMGGPQRYPGSMVGPGRVMGYPSGSTGVPTYR